MTGTARRTAGRPAAAATRSLAVAMAVAFAVAVMAAVVGWGVRSTQGGQAAVDEPQYLLTALSLAEDGDLDIADELAAGRWRAFFDAELPVQTAVLDGGRQISPHDPLLPVLLAGPVRLGGAGWLLAAAKVVVAVAAAATAALLVWLAVRRFAVPPRLAAAGVALAFASPPLAVYSQQIYPEVPAALAVTLGLIGLTGRLGGSGLTALGVAVVALPWLGVKYLPVAAVLALLGLARLLRARRPRAAAGFAAALGLAGAGYLAAHRLIWGGWTVYATGDHFAGTGEFSVVGVDPDYAGRSLRLVGLLVDRAYGLAAWQPAWLLALPALAAVVAVRPRHWAVLLLPVTAGWLVATYVALTMHGFWWPGRQVVAVLPVALVVVLWWLAGASPPVRGIAAILGGAGVAAFAALAVDGWAGEITWVSGFERVDDPLYQAWRAALPDYRTTGAGLWIRHGLWIAIFLMLAVAGWRSRTHSMEGPTHAGSPSHPSYSPPGTVRDRRPGRPGPGNDRGRDRGSRRLLGRWRDRREHRLGLRLRLRLGQPCERHADAQPVMGVASPGSRDVRAAATEAPAPSPQPPPAPAVTAPERTTPLPPR